MNSSEPDSDAVEEKDIDRAGEAGSGGGGRSAVDRVWGREGTKGKREGRFPKDEEEKADFVGLDAMEYVANEDIEAKDEPEMDVRDGREEMEWLKRPSNSSG